MPGWHAFTQSRRNERFEHLSLAIDVQGPSVVKPFVKDVTHPVLVDRAAALPTAFGLEVVPLWFLVDELGIVRAQGGGAWNEKLGQRIDAFLAEAWSPFVPPAQAGKDKPPSVDMAKALAHLQTDAATARDYTNVAALQLAAGDAPTALKTLDAGFAKFPTNWLIRKQRWALKNPERFYEGKVDFRWQKEEIAREAKH